MHIFGPNYMTLSDPKIGPAAILRDPRISHPFNRTSHERQRNARYIDCPSGLICRYRRERALFVALSLARFPPTHLKAK